MRAGLIVGAVALAAATGAQAAPPGTRAFGVYDPDGRFADDAEVVIEHLFLPWEDVFLPSLVSADAYALERNRVLLVTVEPWTWSRSERSTPEVLRAGLANGSYDANMAAICDVLAVLESPVTVRWAQEMEDSDGQFIWSRWTPATYIAAYRRMVGICRDRAPAVSYMWSPLGDEGMQAYYPGDDVVDVVGLSVFGLQSWEEATLGAAQGFRDVLEPRYERAIAFGKPVVVAELGFSGDAAYVASWENVVRRLEDVFPELVAVVYFNQREVYPWPDGFGLPDWRVTSRIDR